MCDVLQVARSGFYAWRHRTESERACSRRRLKSLVRTIHAESKQRYGSPRVWKELASRGKQISENTVASYMREMGIRGKSKKKFRHTTDSNHKLPVAPNILQRKFETARPNVAWVGDITYIPTREGWLYLATVMDLYSRKIVGWSMGRRINRQLVIDAMGMAIGARHPPRGLIFHSDRGSQYASSDFRKLLARHGVVQSMSRKGDCWDNAVMESFYRSLKTELVHHEDYRTRREARRSIFDYIEVFYNRVRRHSTLGYVSPTDYELAL